MLALFGFQGPEKSGAAVPRRQPSQSAAALRNGVLDAMHSQTSGLNPSCHPSSYFKLAYLPSSWQLDGLYTPSLILPLDLRLGAAAPS